MPWLLNMSYIYLQINAGKQARFSYCRRGMEACHVNGRVKKACHAKPKYSLTAIITSISISFFTVKVFSYMQLAFSLDLGHTRTQQAYRGRDDIRPAAFQRTSAQ